MLTDQYFSLPLPWLNWFGNRRKGKALANQIQLFAANLAAGGLGDPPRIDLIGHSNGCCIIVDAVRRLAKRGVRVDTVVLIGAAVNASPERTGLLGLVRSGMLRQAIAWWSPQDGVVGMPAPLRWPYGNLGRTGWAIEGMEAWETVAFWNTKFPRHGHNGYWKPENIEESFELLAQELEIELKAGTVLHGQN